MKTSRISSFNDSFEFSYTIVGKPTPEQAKKSVPSVLCEPVLMLGVIEANQKLHNPLSDEQIKQGLNNITEEDVAGIWPAIVKEKELPLERRRQIIDKERRAICFSDPNKVKRADEILLWSHYANKHQGIRIGFEFPDGIKSPFEIFEMQYQENRPEVVFYPSRDEDAQTLSAIEKAATIKSNCWKYEEEHRLLTRASLCEKGQVKNCDASVIEECFLDFKRQWVKSVEFGVFCPDIELQRVVELLKTDYPNVIPRKAGFHKTEYAFDYNAIQ